MLILDLLLTSTSIPFSLSLSYTVCHSAEAGYNLSLKLKCSRSRIRQINEHLLPLNPKQINTKLPKPGSDT